MSLTLPALGRPGAHFVTALTALRAHSPDLDTTLPDPGSPTTASRPATLDQIVATARHLGVSHAITLTPQADSKSGWLVAENDRTWPVHYDKVLIDPATALARLAVPGQAQQTRRPSP